MTCQLAAGSRWLPARKVSLDLTGCEHSGTVVGPEAAWQSDCSEQLGSVSGLSVLPCFAPSCEVDTDEPGEALGTCAD